MTTRKQVMDAALRRRSKQAIGAAAEAKQQPSPFGEAEAFVHDGVFDGKQQPAQHTPGPWTVDRNTNTDGRDFIVRDSRNRYICGIGRICDHERANARLIAAAPSMLEALEEIEAVTQGLRMDAALSAAVEQGYRAAKLARGE